MKIFKHIEFEGTKTINLGKCASGGSHPVEMYITVPSTVSAVSVKATIDGTDIDISAYNSATYEKASIAGPGAFVVLVAQYDEVALSATGGGTVKVDLYE